MYIFLAFAVVCLVGIPLAIYLENKRISKLEKEKAEGKWDFIDQEYLPYLASHAEPLKKLENVNFSINDDGYKWKLAGVLHYNAAGLYIKFDEVLDKAPRYAFIWGKDKPARFSPAASLHFHSAELKNDMLTLQLKTKAEQTGSNYQLMLKKIPAGVASDLQRVLGS